MTETMGMRIKKRRKELGLSQEQVAEELFIKPETISQYENDKTDIKSSRLIALAEILNVSTDYLLLGRNNETINDEEKELLLIVRNLSLNIKVVAIQQIKALQSIVLD